MFEFSDLGSFDEGIASANANLSSMIVVSIGVAAAVVVDLSEEEECMRDLIRVLCFSKNSNRVTRDSGFVIRSRGRWGKCG